MSIKKKIFLGAIAIIVVLQFFRIERTNPPVDPALEIINLVQTPDAIETILKTSCYDCHSNKSVYPWYTNVAPLSWWIKEHIEHGREELNFSEWGKLSLKRKDHKLDELVEMIEENEMPLKSYLLAHSDARLNADQRAQLIEWAKEVRQELGYKPLDKD